MKEENDIDGLAGLMAIVLVIVLVFGIAFHGEPDLVDALIFWLMK